MFSRSTKTNGGQPRIRRSSTSRSIGNRSSWDVSIGGDRHAEFVESNSDQERRKSEANEHVAKYVSEAMERLRLDHGVTEYDNELEASVNDR